MSDAKTAREVAAHALYRVDHEQAWASAALDAGLARAHLDARDAALATQIVYGALRVLPALDARIDPLLRRGKDSLDPLLRAILRAATYQLMHLARVPAHAVVDGAVRHARRERGKAPSGFVNALLRRIARARPARPEPPTRLALPASLERALSHSLTPERLARFTDARPRPPSIDLRVVGGVASARALADRLRATHARAEVAPGELLEDVLRLRGVGDPRRLPGYDEGLFAVQEEGSRWVAAAVGARPGERVLDACAGRGGKALALAQEVGAGGRVVALELYPQRLERIDAERTRLGLAESVIETRAVDLTVGLGGVEGPFDRVLVDAPCSGLGTVHRRPDILLRHREQRLAELATTQSAILSTVASTVKEAGLLVYAVCSPMREEGVEVVDAFLAEHPEFERATLDLERPPADADSAYRLGPWWAGEGGDATDAYQVFGLRRRS